EVHPYLDEDGEHFSQNSLTEVVKFIIETTEKNQYEIDWELVKDVVAEQKGIPVPIGLHLPELKQVSASEYVVPEENKNPEVENKLIGVDLRLDTDIAQ